MHSCKALITLQKIQHNQTTLRALTSGSDYNDKNSLLNNDKTDVRKPATSVAT